MVPNVLILSFSHMAEKGLPFGALFSMAALKYGMLCIGLFRYVLTIDISFIETDHRYLKNIDCSSFVMYPLLAPHLPRHFWFVFFVLSVANNSTKETNKAGGTCH